jgi:propionyl-CoA synthetase
LLGLQAHSQFATHVPSSAPQQQQQSYEATYAHATEKPTEFWDQQANQLTWVKKWNKTLSASSFRLGSHVRWRWFDGGTLNVCYNAVDRHVLEFGLGDQIAIAYDSPVTGTTRALSYHDLLEQVAKFAGMQPADTIDACTCR